MNKKIILVVAILVIVAVIFVACKGNNDVEEPTESTTETTIEIENGSESYDGDLILSPGGDDDEYFDDTVDFGKGDIVIGGQENNAGEDTIGWDEIS